MVWRIASWVGCIIGREKEVSCLLLGSLLCGLRGYYLGRLDVVRQQCSYSYVEELQYMEMPV